MANLEMEIFVILMGQIGTPVKAKTYTILMGLTG
jgi:hypothetical protein